MKSNRTKDLQFALLLTIILSAILIIGFNSTKPVAEGISINRLFQIFGGDFINGGYIQVICYFAFFWGLFEIFENKKYIEYQLSGLKRNLIPEEGNNFFVFYSENVNTLNKEMVKYDDEIKTSGKQQLLIVDIIKKSCLKYLNTKQISEVIDLISAQVRINQAKSESRHSMIRYLTWVIPSIGFVGTVIGIGLSLGAASIEPMDRTLVTSMLSVAFDTTLIALLLSIVLMYFYHVLQSLEDKFHSDTEEYLIDNMVNRIKPD